VGDGVKEKLQYYVEFICKLSDLCQLASSLLKHF